MPEYTEQDVQTAAMAEQQLMLSDPAVAQAIAVYLQQRNLQLALRVRELEAE